MKLQREHIAWLLVLSLGIYVLPKDLFELARTYVVSTVAFITTILAILFNAPKFIDMLIDRIAIRVAERIAEREEVERKMEVYKKSLQREGEQEQER